jgi:hypothetical protein
MSVSQEASEAISNYFKNESDNIEAYPIYVKNGSNEQMITINGSSQTTIRDLKMFIQNQEGIVWLVIFLCDAYSLGIPEEYLDLFFGESVPLESDKSLQDYGIKADDILMSHYSLRGGITLLVLLFSFVCSVLFVLCFCSLLFNSMECVCLCYLISLLHFNCISWFCAHCVGNPGGSCNCSAGCKPKWSNRCCCWQCSCDCTLF